MNASLREGRSDEHREPAAARPHAPEPVHTRPPFQSPGLKSAASSDAKNEYTFPVAVTIHANDPARRFDLALTLADVRELAMRLPAILTSAEAAYGGQ